LPAELWELPCAQSETRPTFAVDQLVAVRWAKHKQKERFYEARSPCSRLCVTGDLLGAYLSLERREGIPRGLSAGRCTEVCVDPHIGGRHRHWGVCCGEEAWTPAGNPWPSSGALHHNLSAQPQLLGRVGHASVRRQTLQGGRQGARRRVDWDDDPLSAPHMVRPYPEPLVAHRVARPGGSVVTSAPASIHQQP
jgi:hypothetical protein